jgi:hypothetical protein
MPSVFFIDWLALRNRVVSRFFGGLRSFQRSAFSGQLSALSPGTRSQFLKRFSVAGNADWLIAHG